MPPRPKPRPKPKPVGGRGQKRSLKTTKGKIGKKIATAALAGSIAASSFFVGKKVQKAVRPHSVNSNLRRASGNYLSEIKSARERVGELNAKARKEHAQKLQKSKKKDIKRKLYFYDEKQNKIRAVEMDAVKAMEIEKKQKGNFERVERVVEKKVKELNNKSRPEEVFFWNGDKISKVDLGVAKLRNVYDKLYASEKAQLDSIYSDIVRELRTNDRFSGEVAIKMGELNDTARMNYLSSLSVGEFATRFGNNPKIINRLNEVIKSLEMYKDKKNPGNSRHSREVLNYVQKEARLDSGITGVGAGVVTGVALLSLWSKFKSYSRRKRK